MLADCCGHTDLTGQLSSRSETTKGGGIGGIWGLPTKTAKPQWLELLVWRKVLVQTNSGLDMVGQ